MGARSDGDMLGLGCHCLGLGRSASDSLLRERESCVPWRCYSSIYCASLRTAVLMVYGQCHKGVVKKALLHCNSCSCC
jgi:hypothetical protein